MFTYPCVFEGPSAVKLSSMLSGLNINCVIVELEVKLKTFCSSAAARAKFTVLLTPFKLDVFSKVAVIR